MFDPAGAESERLAAVERCDLLDTPREPLFDNITRLARRVLGMPVAALSVIDGHRQWFKALDGLQATEVPRNHTICSHVLATGRPLIISDVSGDPRFAERPWVTSEPHVRSYAGVPLTTKDGFVIGTLCTIGREPRSFSESDTANLHDLAAIAMEAIEYRQLANTDFLTGVQSRRAFKEAAGKAVALAVRHGTPLSVIVLDIDRFKSVNDTYGHAVGDVAIGSVVRACAERLRATDFAGRLGGEEFSFVLPHTDRKRALGVAEQLRQAVERLTIPAGGGELRVTASFGVSALDRETRDVEELLRKADEALYGAKASGRNRCQAAPASDVEPEDTSRRRVFKGGQIIFGDSISTVDCTVRSLSDRGAGLDVFSSAGLPEEFLLSIRGDRQEVPCRVLSRGERHIDVEFLRAA